MARSRYVCPKCGGPVKPDDDTEVYCERCDEFFAHAPFSSPEPRGSTSMGSNVGSNPHPKPRHTAVCGQICTSRGRSRRSTRTALHLAATHRTARTVLALECGAGGALGCRWVASNPQNERMGNKIWRPPAA